MKKAILILFAVAFAATSSVVFSAGGHKGGGSSHQGAEGVTSSPMDTPRGYGVKNPEDVLDDEKQHQNFQDAAAGAWSNDKVPGKDKPSDD